MFNINSLLKNYGVDSAKLEEAKKLATKYGDSQEGFIKALDEIGGIQVLEPLLPHLKNPMVAMGLKAFAGIDASQIEHMLNTYKQSKTTGYIPQAQQPMIGSKPITSSNNNDIMNRLNKLKR